MTDLPREPVVREDAPLRRLILDDQLRFLTTVQEADLDHLDLRRIRHDVPVQFGALTDEPTT
ncbi:MAG: hypothetical protein EPO26_07750 [Chloroflexota bacterium]|nr:MAG: hypothetical protein EPO26_07750 [Chloroflexota bacterium]